MYHSRYHETRYLDGKKVIVDLAERDYTFNAPKLNTVYPKYELMVMYPDGEEIESMTTNDFTEATSAYQDALKRYSKSDLKGKYAKLRDDLIVALNAAKEADTGDDGGTCNHDAPSIKLPRWIESKVIQAAEEAGTSCFKWELYGGARYVFNPKSSGQANRRCRASEAMEKALQEAGYECVMYCQMD